VSRALSVAATGAVLVGPTAVAFASGGFFDTPRLVAGIVACALVLAAAVAAPRPVPAGLPGRLALGGLAGLTAWAAVSLAWAPLGGPAIDDVQRLVLYTASLTAAAAWLRGGRAAEAAEPALALGALAVVGHGLSERLLPGLLDFEGSQSAEGRLEQPVTYWNAMGALAALGLVLCTRLAGSPGRPALLRAAAAAAVPTLAAGLYLTFSRGALAALAAGLLVLLALASDQAQARAVAVGALAGAPTMALAGVLPGVKQVDADGAGDGALLLGGLLVLGLAAGAAQLLLAGREQEGQLSLARLDPRGLRAAAAALGLGLVVAAVLAAGSGDAGRGAPAGAEAGRLRSLESSRYDYWEVAVTSFAGRPLGGVGTAGFRAEWERERDLPESTRDAHSLYLETAAELGLVGFVLLGLLLAGVALAGRAAYGRAPGLATGPAAALAAWALHAGFDWDWEMPAVTLPALALAGLLVVLSEDDPDARAKRRRASARSMPAAASTTSESSAA
jgi:hypothetical protein